MLTRLQRGVAAVGPADVREAAARHLHPQAAAAGSGSGDRKKGVEAVAAAEAAGSGGGDRGRGKKGVAAAAEAAETAGRGGEGGRQVVVVVGDAAVVRGSLLASGYAEEDLVAVTLPDLLGAGPPA